MRQKTIDATMAHAAAEYPSECCGVVAQKAGLSAIFPAATCQQSRLNIFICHLKITPRRRTGVTVTAIVHSHPDATTQPSELDKAQCDAGCRPWHTELLARGLRTIQPRGELPLLERPFVLGHFDCWG